MTAPDEVHWHEPSSPWRKSAASNTYGGCVEAAAFTGLVAVRDSRNPDGPQLRFAPEVWQAFVRRLK